MGRLHLIIQPLYAQSRDITADKENIYQLQPNMFSPSLDMTTSAPAAVGAKEKAAVNPLTEPMVADTGTVVMKPVLRENARAISPSLPGTVRSLSPSQINTIRSSQASAIQSSIVGDGVNELVLESPESTPGHHISSSISPRQVIGTHDSELSPASSASQKDSASGRTEIKKVLSPVSTSLSISKEGGYVSHCKAIVLKAEYKSVDQGFRLIPRLKNDYVERMTFVW